ncbi:MAG: efflux RND transporter periplasmic adaptor subunit [Mycobacteriales bacterium]
MQQPRPARPAYAVATLAVALAVAGCSGSSSRPISVAPVGRATVTEVVEAPATVAARATTTLSSPADGMIAELGVRDGQSVRAGTVLMRVESPSARQRLRDAEQADMQAAAGRVRLPGADLSGLQAQADAAAEAAFTAARSGADALPTPVLRAAAHAREAAAEARYRAARASAAAAAARFNAGLGSLSSALSSLATASRVQTRAAVGLARQTVAALVVRAPITGVVSLGAGTAGTGSSDVSGLIGSLPSSVQGQAAQALGGGAGGGSATTAATIALGVPVSSGTALATVTDISSLSVVADVDETDVLLVKPGVLASVNFDAVPDATYSATVEGLGLAPVTTAGGGVTYRVRLRLGPGRLADGGPAPRPRPGMSAVAELQVRRALGAVAVPASAVVREGTRDAIFVVVDGRARHRIVTLGAQGDEQVQVVEGVRVGDRVVVRGADSVRDGQKLPAK